MSKDNRYTPAQKAAPPPKDDPQAATPDGRWYRFRRGRGDYAPYVGADVLEFINGRPVVREFVFPNLPDVTEGKVVAEMFLETK